MIIRQVKNPESLQEQYSRQHQDNSINQRSPMFVPAKNAVQGSTMTATDKSHDGVLGAKRQSPGIRPSAILFSDTHRKIAEERKGSDVHIQKQAVNIDGIDG